MTQKIPYYTVTVVLDDIECNVLHRDSIALDDREGTVLHGESRALDDRGGTLLYGESKALDNIECNAMQCITKE